MSDSRERLFGGNLSNITIISATGVDGRLKSSTELRKGLGKMTATGYRFAADFRGTSFEDFEEIQIDKEMTVSGIRKPEPPTVIERIRAEHPNRNVCAAAVEALEHPTEMSQFLIQYAQELGRTSERPETRANPFDTAVELVDRMASLRGGDIANRWHELIDTGTVKNPPDHSLDWITSTRSGRK